MRLCGACSALLVALALSLAPAALPAAEPEKVGTPFDVRVSPGPGGPEVDMTFTVSLSDVSTYPVTITAIAGTVEEQLWQGTLPEGVYRFKGQLRKITSGQVRLVLKVRMTNLESGGGGSYHVYRRWEGTIR